LWETEEGVGVVAEAGEAFGSAMIFSVIANISLGLIDWPLSTYTFTSIARASLRTAFPMRVW
jgi:hypothetical protein